VGELGVHEEWSVRLGSIWS